jgi:two-component system, chemotaxis family, response regulator Rcp1
MQKTIHLLLVEDNPGDVLLIRESLRQCSVSVDVTIAEDGTGALAILNGGFKADIIILDLNIPRMDGYAVMERLGRISTPIIVFTWSTEGAERALSLGAQEVVQKPGDFSEFVKAVCRIVDTWGKSRSANGAAC